MHLFVIILLMQNAAPMPSSITPEVSTMSDAQLLSLVRSQAETIAALKHQLDWFRRQVFGQKSERFAPEPDPAQMHLGEVLPIPTATPEKVKAIAAHTRRTVQKDGAQSGEELKFFDESKLPVESIVLVHEDAQDLAAGEFELIGEKITYRLAQRPGSYVVLKYHRPVMKRKDTQTILTAPAPEGFLEGSRADVSFAAGLLMDKFAWHLPLYRQHQRLAASGSRSLAPGSHSLRKVRSASLSRSTRRSSPRSGRAG